jgi:hypothetical protein
MGWFSREWCCPDFRSAFEASARSGLFVFAEGPAPGDPSLYSFWLAFRCVARQHRGRVPPAPPAPPGVEVCPSDALAIAFCPWCGRRLVRYYGRSAIRLRDRELCREFWAQVDPYAFLMCDVTGWVKPPMLTRRITLAEYEAGRSAIDVSQIRREIRPRVEQRLAEVAGVLREIAELERQGGELWEWSVGGYLAAPGGLAIVRAGAVVRVWRDRRLPAVQDDEPSPWHGTGGTGGREA